MASNHPSHLWSQYPSLHLNIAVQGPWFLLSPFFLFLHAFASPHQAYNIWNSWTIFWTEGGRYFGRDPKFDSCCRLLLGVLSFGNNAWRSYLVIHLAISWMIFWYSDNLRQAETLIGQRCVEDLWLDQEAPWILQIFAHSAYHAISKQLLPRLHGLRLKWCRSWLDHITRWRSCSAPAFAPSSHGDFSLNFTSLTQHGSFIDHRTTPISSFDHQASICGQHRTLMLFARRNQLNYNQSNNADCACLEPTADWHVEVQDHSELHMQ